jgi:hypothetical protein
MRRRPLPPLDRIQQSFDLAPARRPSQPPRQGHRDPLWLLLCLALYRYGRAPSRLNWQFARAALHRWSVSFTEIDIEEAA